MPAPRFVLDDFWPSDLFLGGIPGAWYDPTDLSTMFQDSTGTTPVTAVEQPVGLILDKSQGLAQGSQLVVNGDGTTLTGWTTSDDAGCSSSVSGGQFVLATVAGGAARLRQTIPTTAGKTYAISIFCNTSASNATAAFTVWGAAYGITTLYSAPSVANGVITAIVQATSANIYLQLSAFSGSTGLTNFYDNVSVRELAGNHASQSTAASRPTYRARYNLLTFSEQFQNSVWANAAPPADCTVATNQTAPDGTATGQTLTPSAGGTAAQRRQFINAGAGTYTFSIYIKQGTSTRSQIIVWRETFAALLSATAITWAGGAPVLGGVTAGTWQTPEAVGGGWYRLTGTAVAPSGVTMIFVGVFPDNIAGTGTLSVWGAQLLTAADVTATGNAYQRIAAATVYDTAAVFRPYLAFDGVDDGLGTSAINFSTTDNVSTFTGITKNADGASGAICELSVDSNTNNGTFVLLAPTSAAASSFNWQVRGTSTVTNAVANQLPAPATAVLTSTASIAAPSSVSRKNAVLVQALVTSLGTGNFGTYPFFIGARNLGAGLRFNGRIYSLIVRGAASSTTEIADTELWVNARTGAY